MKRTFILFLLASLLYLPSMSQKKIRVACVGNSVTYGYGLSDREQTCYPTRLQEMLGDGYEVRNFGNSGTTLLFKGHKPYIKVQEFRDAMDFKADLVIIHLGLNDTDPRNWPEWKEEFIPNYRALIDSFRVANPKAKIWICKMTPIFHGHRRFESGTRDWHAQIQTRIEQIARTSQVRLIDLFTPLHCHPEMFPDALHPNPDGAMILAKTVYGAISGDYSGLQIPALYTDGMVIQRNESIKFHGIADYGEEVTVEFNGMKRKTIGDDQGHWDVTFPQMDAGGPYEITFKAKSCKYIIRNAWVGEVWLCSGQSNMEFKVQQSVTAKQDYADADRLKNLHIFNMPALSRTDNVTWPDSVLEKNNRLEHLRMGPWENSSSESVKDFSAIAFNFGRVLADSLNIPIGIICNAVGGTTTESWIDRTSIENEFPQILRNWTENDLTQAWVRERAKYNNKNATNKMQRHPYEPCYMYEAGIRPLEQYNIRGVLWYQGESNADRLEVHNKLFPMLVKSWRNNWNKRDLPFYTVQLSSLNRHHFPQFRDAQRRLAKSINNVWMAVTIDVGDSLDVHPRMKRPVGERLAALALNHTYNYNIESEGPELKDARRAGDALELTFSHADGMSITRGFEIAGDDGLYYPAEARIADNRIVLKSKNVKTPCSVRYGWQPFTRADLRNKQGFPAPTFIKENIY